MEGPLQTRGEVTGEPDPTTGAGDVSASPAVDPHKPRRRIGIPVSIVLLVAAILAWYRFTITRPDYRYASAMASIANRQWDSAEWMAARLESAGRNDLAILIRAESWIQRGDPAAAFGLLHDYPPEGARRDEAAAKVGRSLMGLHRPRQAYAAFRLALELQPDHAEARRGSAQIAYNLGQLDTAKEHLRQLIALEPGDGKPRKLLGDIQADLGQHEPAVEAYRGALDAKLTSALVQDVRLSLAKSLAKLGRFDELLKVREEALRAGGDESAEWAALHVEALRAGGQNDKARAAVEAAVKNFPKSPALHALLGQLELDAGRSAAAATALAKAHELAPRDYPTCLLYSQTLAADGRTAEAERFAKLAEVLQKDLELITKLTSEAERKPWDAAVRLQLAEVSERMGNSEMAEQWRAAAAALSP